MKKNDTLILTFYGEGGCALLERKLTSVPLAEKTVLALSVEFFSDPEPCMIHRSAVMSRMYMETLEFFTASMQGGQGEYRRESLPGRIASFFNVEGWRKIAVKAP